MIPQAVDRGHYRHIGPRAAFMGWNMPACHFLKSHWRAASFSGLLAPTLWICGCDAPKKETVIQNAPAETKEVPSPALAAAKLDWAKTRLADGFQNEALLLTVSALEADASFPEAREMAMALLSTTHWQITDTSIRFPLPIDRIEVAPPSSLWISLTGEQSTIVRWNLESGRVENVMFPIKADGSRVMVFDARHRHVVIQRRGITLLSDAQTLKPIRDLGILPDDITPSSNIVFSADGLLFAHPARVSENDPALVWQLRDSGTGEILRASEPESGPAIRPVAAHLDRQSLKVLRSNGSVLDMPVSPVETLTLTPPKDPVNLLHAVFSTTAGAADALFDRGPHATPERGVLVLSQPMAALSPIETLAGYPWSGHPCVWNGLLKYTPGFRVEGNLIRFEAEDRAPIRLASETSAFALSGDRFLTGERNGTLGIHHGLGPLGRKPATSEAPAPEAARTGELRKLAEFLTGMRFDETRRVFENLEPAPRMALMGSIDFGVPGKMFPELDFGPLRDSMARFQPPKIAENAMTPLVERLARSSPPHPAEELVKVFENAGDEAVLAAIRQAGPRDAMAAKALELSLDSTHANWIRACLEQAKDLPPLLEKLAVSRIAWLEDRKADAIAGWPDVFPDLTQVRLREDWDGWEQADFKLAMEKLKLCIREILDALEVPPDSTPEQRKAVFDRLMNPETVVAVGKPRYARACLHAALAFSKFKDEKETTFQLATIARNLGEAAAPCLRAEAMALTAMGDYQQARERWISLITEHPVAEQEPGDYAEAAYTSFENADPQQAMNILTTGMHRFPDDANFALRAGWVSLLTGNSERAYRFLLTGKQIGYPDGKLENATALLAIAAVQTGANEDAGVFYQDLIALDPAWQDAATIESLDWPEELKASLRQLVW